MKEIYTDLEEVIKNKLPDPTHDAKIIYVDNNGDVVAETIKNMNKLIFNNKEYELIEIDTPIFQFSSPEDYSDIFFMKEHKHPVNGHTLSEHPTFMYHREYQGKAIQFKDKFFALKPITK